MRADAQRRRSPGRVGPRPLPASVWLIILLAFTPVIMYGLLHGVSGYRQSGRAQHGVQVHGVVSHIKVTDISSRGDRAYTSAVRVDISEGQPVAGVTTAHVRGVSPLRWGENTTVLVDPRDVEYAEFAGAPFVSGPSVVFGGFLLAAALVADVLLLVQVVRTWRRNHGRRKPAVVH